MSSHWAGQFTLPAISDLISFFAISLGPALESFDPPVKILLVSLGPDSRTNSMMMIKSLQAKMDIFRNLYLWEVSVALGPSIYRKVPGRTSEIYFEIPVNKDY